MTPSIRILLLHLQQLFVPIIVCVGASLLHDVVDFLAATYGQTWICAQITCIISNKIESVRLMAEKSGNMNKEGGGGGLPEIRVTVGCRSIRSLLEPAPLRGGLLSRLRLDDDMPSTNYSCYQVIVFRVVFDVRVCPVPGYANYRLRSRFWLDLVDATTKKRRGMLQPLLGIRLLPFSCESSCSCPVACNLYRIGLT